MKATFSTLINKHKDWLLFLLPIICILFIFRHVVFGNNFFYNGDSLYSFFPYFDYKLKGGSVIAQQILSGFPVLVSVTGVWFYPINRLAALFFNPLRAYALLDVFNILLTYILVYWYCRKISFSHLVAILVSFIFTTSGQLLLWSETLTNTNYYFLLPAALISIEYLFHHKNKWSYFCAFIGLSLSLGVGWLSGHVQYIVYIHVFAAIYFVFLLYVHNQLISFKDKATKSILFIIANVGSFIIGFPQIVAILTYRAVSVRSSGVRISDFFEGSYLPQDILHYFLPFYKIQGISFSNPNLYIGILPFVLLILSFVYLRKIKEKRFYFYTSIFVIVIVASVRYSPIGLIFHYLPLFNSFREAPRMMFIGAFAESLMIGYTLNFLFSKEYKGNGIETTARLIKKGTLYVLLPLIIIFTIAELFLKNILISFLQNYFVTHLYQKTAHLNLSHYFSIIKQTVNSFLYQFSFFDPHVLILLSSLVFAYILFKNFKKYNQTVIVSFAILINIIAITFTYSHYFKYISNEVINSQPHTVTAIRTLENGSKEPFRVFSIFPGLTLYNELTVRCENTLSQENFLLQKEMLEPNINIYYDIDVIDGYDNFMSRSISEVLARVGSEQSVTGNLLANLPIPIEERIQKIVEQKNILQMMNVKYVISHYAINDPDFEPVFNESLGICDTEIFMYRLHGTWPRYFLTAQNIDEIEQSNTWQPLQPEFGFNTVTWRTTSIATTTLFVGNNYLPQYSATIDGKTVPIHMVKDIYMAVVVPAGNHRVTLTYAVPPNPLKLH